MNPWWSSETAVWFGIIGGGVGGPLIGSLGAAMGILAPRGKCKGFIVGTQSAFAGIGALLLLGGIVAVIAGQPYHVYYPALITGFVAAAVMGGLLPVTLARYRQAEKRKLDAEEFRRT